MYEHDAIEGKLSYDRGPWVLTINAYPKYTSTGIESLFVLTDAIESWNTPMPTHN